MTKISETKRKELGLDKFKFKEDFVDPDTGRKIEAPDSPHAFKLKFAGIKTLHRICKIDWYEKIVDKSRTEVLENGETIQTKYKEKVFVPLMGKDGGWLEFERNLSQSGDCWVEREAKVCEDAQVIEDALVSGETEISGVCKVRGKAQVHGGWLFGGVLVAGEAEIRGDPDICGYAKIYGKVFGTHLWPDGVRVSERAIIWGSGLTNDNSTVYGRTQIYGKVLGWAIAGGRSKIYGLVTSDNPEKPAMVMGDAIIAETGIVQDSAYVTGLSVVCGKVMDRAQVYKGKAYVGESGTLREDAIAKGNSQVFGDVGLKSTVVGNACLLEGGAVNNKSNMDRNAVASGSIDQESSVTDNGEAEVGAYVQSSIGENGTCNGSCTESTINGTAWAKGSYEKTNIGGAVRIKGSAVKSYLYGGRIDVDANKSQIYKTPIIQGEIDDVHIAGSVIIRRGAGAFSSGAAFGNVKICDKTSGDHYNNGLLLADSPGTTNNGIVLKDGGSAGNNQVYLEEGNDSPAASAVICEVEQ